MVVEWPFVGRIDEAKGLQDLIVGGSHAAAVVTGPAGVGKTRLAGEALQAVERTGVKVLRATATRATTGLPFGALAGLLPTQMPTMAAPVAGGHPSSVTMPHRLDLAGLNTSPADLLHRWAEALATESRPSERLVLFVDDAHHLDDASAALLLHLVDTSEVFVLVTTRTGESAPDPVVALWKDAHAERIELGTLDPADIDQLLTHALGSPVDPATRGELCRRAGGNVLFLRELVLGALEQNVLVEDDGLWHLRGDLPLTGRLIELVEARLDQVGSDEQALLELVAFGEPLGSGELDALSDPVLAETLEHRRLLSSTFNRRRLEVRLSHPLYGDVLRAQVPAVRQRRICRQLAEAIEATGARRRGDALRVATWRLTGGAGDPGTLLAGARAAHARGDLALAEKLARAAADSGAGFDAELLAAELASGQGRTADAHQELASLALRATDDDQRGRVALSRITNSVTWQAEDPLHIIDDARDSVTTVAWRDRLDAERLSLLDLTRGPEHAATEALELLGRVGGAALAAASIPGAVALGRTGRIAAALDAADRGEAAHRALPEPLTWQPWWHDISRAQALRLAGHFAATRRITDAGYEWALASGSLEAQAVYALTSGASVAECGGAPTAARRAQETVMRARELKRPVLERLGLTLWALASALAGDLVTSRRALAELDALPLPPVVDSVDPLGARAWAAAVCGDLVTARRELTAMAETAHTIGDLVGETAAWHGLARLGRPRQALTPLAKVADRVEGPLTQLRLRHTRALADNDPAQLEAVSVQWDDLGADLLAAEAAADAAVAHLRAGSGRAAAAQERRAAELAERCGHPVTPSLQQVTARTWLTEAERETALLAASGYANREIAGRLHLSVRTVENRLQRVYSKLGVRRRTELPTALNGS